MSRLLSIAPKLILAVVTALFTVLLLFRLGADAARANPAQRISPLSVSECVPGDRSPASVCETGTVVQTGAAAPRS